MLPVTVDGEIFKVTWKHDRSNNITDCYISVKNGEEHRTIATGTALCHHVDNFNYNIGRKLSLSRAVVELFPRVGPHGKATRKLFWDAYQSMRNGKW